MNERPATPDEQKALERLDGIAKEIVRHNRKEMLIACSATCALIGVPRKTLAVAVGKHLMVDGALFLASGAGLTEQDAKDTINLALKRFQELAEISLGDDMRNGK